MNIFYRPHYDCSPPCDEHAAEADRATHWHHRCDIPACNCGRCHDCGEQVPEADRGTFVQGIRDPKATARSIADAALDAAREAAESRPDPKHGPHGNEGYCYCGVFVGHDGDWSSHRAETPVHVNDGSAPAPAEPTDGSSTCRSAPSSASPPGAWASCP